MKEIEPLKKIFRIITDLWNIKSKETKQNHFKASPSFASFCSQFSIYLFYCPWLTSQKFLTLYIIIHSTFQIFFFTKVPLERVITLQTFLWRLVFYHKNSVNFFEDLCVLFYSSEFCFGFHHMYFSEKECKFVFQCNVPCLSCLLCYICPPVSWAYHFRPPVIWVPEFEKLTLWFVFNNTPAINPLSLDFWIFKLSVVMETLKFRDPGKSNTSCPLFPGC